MGTSSLIVRIFYISLCILTLSAEFLLENEHLLPGLAYFEQLSPQSRLDIENQIHSQLFKNDQNSSLFNLIGILAYDKGNWTAASQHFRKACQIEGYGHEAYVRNWIEAERKSDSSSIIITLRNTISKNMERSSLLQALIDEVQNSNSEYSYRQMLQIIRQFPSRYEFWLVFVNLHINYHFAKSSKHTNGDAERVSYEEEALLVQYGLTMFPNSPELLLVRTMHLLSINDVGCAEVFMGKTQRYRGFDQGVVPGTHYETVANAVTAAVIGVGVSDSTIYTTHTYCMPSIEQHSIASYQPIYALVNSIAGEQWARAPNITSFDQSVENSLLTSSILETYDTNIETTTAAEKVFLPSLQVGCNRYDVCALPGFLIADAMPAITTHFLTHGYDLHMIANASIGLVYSSHMLEHLSHTLPPASCREDAGSSSSSSTTATSSTHIKRAVHCEQSELDATLTEWRRVLSPGGRLLVSVPDLSVLAATFIHERTTPEDRIYLMKFMFGGQIDQYDFHKVGFYPEYMMELLTSHGFCNITQVPEFAIFKDASWNMVRISLSVHAIAC